jgi:hypothetical protein
VSCCEDWPEAVTHAPAPPPKQAAESALQYPYCALITPLSRPLSAPPVRQRSAIRE